MTALQFPKVMEFLPVLLPRHFKRLISSGSTKVLEDIEEMLGTHPWKLGFSKVSKTLTLVILCKGGFLKLYIFTTLHLQTLQFLHLFQRKKICMDLNVDFSFSVRTN